MARILYSFILCLLVPFVLIKFFIRARRNPAYSQRIAERFACHPYPKFENCVVFHLVSVGETLAAISLIKRFMAAHPELQIVVTSTTPTGSERVEKAFGDSVFNCYLPFDLAWVQRRFLTQLNPKLIVLMETELWPNLLHYANRRKIPTLLMNARLSERSAKGYQKFAWFTQPMLQDISHISAQFQADAERFKQLGLVDSKVSVAGNLKFDIAVQAEWQKQAQLLQQIWQCDRPIWIAASTHKGEDEQLLAAHKLIVEQYPQAILLLVPRHPERFEQVYQLSTTQFSTQKRSDNLAIQSETQVIIGDSMGEMMALYQLADIAFVAGSLIEHGGHNPLEPAVLAKPVISGKHVFNFSFIFELMQQKQAVTIVETSEELAAAICHLLQNPQVAELAGKKALAMMDELKGASEQTLNLIDSLLVTKT